MAAIDWDHYEVRCGPDCGPSSSPPTSAPVMPPLASVRARLCASGIDLVLLFVVYASWRYALEMSEDYGDHPTLVQRLLALGVLGLVSTQLSLFTWHGQTIGKWLLGVRIVRFGDGGNPGFLRVVVLRLLVPALIGGVPVLGRVFHLADLLNIYGEERRCLHDCIAGTEVVEA